MKLWLIEAKNTNGWDIYLGFVIRAETEAAARRIARDTANEGLCWQDPAGTTCTEVEPDGEAGVILESFKAG